VLDAMAFGKALTPALIDGEPLLVIEPAKTL
jgi:hypothetical protein